MPFNQIFSDLDGTLTGFPQGTLIPYSPFNDFGGVASGCSRAGRVFDDGILCDSSETVCAPPFSGGEGGSRGMSRDGPWGGTLAEFSSRHVASTPPPLTSLAPPPFPLPPLAHTLRVPTHQVRRLAIDGVNPRELDFRALAVVSSAGAGTVQFRPREEYGWVTPVVMRRVYSLYFKAVPDFQAMRVKVGEPEYMGPGEWVELRVNFTNKRSYYKTAIAAANGSFVVPVRCAVCWG
jgi:hypothetical protein